MRLTTTCLLHGVRNYSVNNLPKTTFSRLSNGLAVATVQTDSPLTTIGVSFKAGSAYENRKTNGVSSVLQGLAYKPSKSKSKDFIKNIESKLGASLETTLDREQLSYFANVENSRAGEALSAIGGSISDNINQDDFEHSKTRTLKLVKGAPTFGTGYLYDHLHTVAFQDGPHSLPHRGSVESLEALSKDDVLEHRKNTFVTSRAVVTAAGGLSHDQVVKAAQAAFGSLPEGSVQEAWSPFTGAMVRISDDEFFSDAEMAFAYGGPGRDDPEYDVIQLVTHLTGKWDKFKNAGRGSSSRIIDYLIEEGFGNKVEAFYIPHSKVGLFGVYLHGAADYHIRTDLPKVALTYFVDLGLYLTDNEVSRAKAKYSNAILRGYDGPQKTFETVTRDVLQLGQPREVESALNQVAGISREHIKKVLQKFTFDVDVSVAASGQLPAFPDYNYIRRWTYYNSL
eukprot:TRINITY_DN10963_c0_g1_i1.p1 TRINITY_DN10963_c0_g1~~TRINITY_DN10963_c0_g1_i1.p1  ORF type:complete len:453 (-),score=99.40 TRINITY_DN10963_c0_g1_i1:91-1449(-)